MPVNPNDVFPAALYSLYDARYGQLSDVTALLAAQQAGGFIAYATKAELDADLAHAANTPGLVMLDTTPANNGYYIKVGASGAGSWSQAAFPYRVGIPVSEYTNLTAALGAMSAGNTLVVNADTTLTTSEECPAGVTIQMMQGNVITLNSGQTLTINGAFEAGLYPCFTGAGLVVFGVGAVTEVYPEWWGCESKASKATAADCTAAITAALTTGKNTILGHGYYGTTGGHALSYDGQKFKGAGQRSVTRGGTALVKLSGTNKIVTVGAYGGLELADMLIDANSLAGNAVYDVSYYSHIHDLTIDGQGGTDYALYALDWNVNRYENLVFGDNNYGGIKLARVASAGYSQFDKIIIGKPAGAGYALDIGVNCVGLQFNSLDSEGAILITGAVDDIQFNNLQSEYSITDKPFMRIAGTTSTHGVFINGARIMPSAASTEPVFDFVGGYGIAIRDLYVRDAYNAAGKRIIRLDGVTGFRLENAHAYMNDTYKMIDCATNISSQLTVTDVFNTSGAAGSLSLWANYVSLNNTPLAIDFNAASEQIVGNLCVGTIDLTNAQDYAWTRSAAAATTPFTFADQDATPSVRKGDIYSAANTIATTITTFDGGTSNQIITITFTNGNTTIAETGNIVLSAAFTSTAGDSMTLIYSGTEWIELARSVN